MTTEEELKELLNDLERAAGNVAGAYEWGTFNAIHEKEIVRCKLSILAAFAELRNERDGALEALRKIENYYDGWARYTARR